MKRITASIAKLTPTTVPPMAPWAPVERPEDWEVGVGVDGRPKGAVVDVFDSDWELKSVVVVIEMSDDEPDAEEGEKPPVVLIAVDEVK